MTKRPLFALIVLCLLGPVCPGHGQLIVAHRGASHDAPENTLAAFDLAFAQHADAIEGDFRLTADGRVVALHDASFRRTAGVARRIAELTLADVARLDVGAWKGEAFAGEVAPTLDAVLQRLPEGAHFFIELKTGPEIVPPMLRAIDASGIDPARLTIIAFDAEVIATVERHRPELCTAWLVKFEEGQGGAWTPSRQDVLQTLGRINADGLDTHANLAVLTPAFVQALRDASYQWHCWTVDDPTVARHLIDLGVDSLTTNQPATLRAAL